MYQSQQELQQQLQQQQQQQLQQQQQQQLQQQQQQQQQGFFYQPPQENGAYFDPALPPSAHVRIGGSPRPPRPGRIDLSAAAHSPTAAPAAELFPSHAAVADGNFYPARAMPSPPRSFQPFVQSGESAAAFHERHAPTKGPFHQSPQPPPFHPSHAAAESAAAAPARAGLFARVLNAFVSPETNGASSSSSAAPLHQTRFGFEEDDLPLLEELGIFPAHIRAKAVSVMHPFRSVPREVMEDMDLAGPVVFAIALAILLTLRGKVQFSAVYGHSVIGVLFTKALLSLMADSSVPLQLVISSLGYCLIPNVVLAGIHLVLYCFFGHIGRTMIPLALLIVAWSAWCATAMLVDGLMMEKQRYLIMYPMFLFYAVFAMLTIF